GIDISSQTSKPMDRFLDQHFTYVICVCDRAAEDCPVWLRPREQIHWSFADPAQARGTEQERLAAFRKGRNEIQPRIQLALLAAKVHVQPPLRSRLSAGPTA